jgi:hypothetical protein
MSEKTYNALEVLQAASGIPMPEVKAIWESVKANQAKLDQCPRHEFTKQGEGMRATYTCRHCGGTVRPIEHKWYQQGLKHGGQ